MDRAASAQAAVDATQPEPAGPPHGARRTAALPRQRRGQWRNAALGYAFIAPAGVLFIVFILAPFVGAVPIALLDWDLLRPASQTRFVGLDNFRMLLDDPVALKALTNTIGFAIGSVTLHVVFGLVFALAAHSVTSKVLRYYVRSFLFFPFLMSWAAVALIWRALLNPTFGFISYYLSRLGFDPPNWTLSPTWALPSIMGVDLWYTLGFTFIILLAGLQNIPVELYEAAKVDGAGVWARFHDVTIPMLSPTIFFVVVTGFIGAFQIFEPVFIITQGGPGDETKTLVMYIFEKGFRTFQMGYAAAISLVLLLLILICTLVQFRLQRRWVHYE